VTAGAAEQHHAMNIKANKLDVFFFIFTLGF
jgi:hypothetical protein